MSMIGLGDSLGKLGRLGDWQFALKLLLREFELSYPFIHPSDATCVSNTNTHAYRDLYAHVCIFLTESYVLWGASTMTDKLGHSSFRPKEDEVLVRLSLTIAA